MIYFSLALLFFLSVAFTYYYIDHAYGKNWLDIPKSRSAHTELTPRGAGIVFISLWLGAVIIALFFKLWTVSQALILLPGVVIVATFGFLDDVFSLRASWRALAYLVAALMSVIALDGIENIALTKHLILHISWLGSVVAVLAVAWSTNLFNFMDGLDGFAATEALFMLGVGGFFFSQSGATGLAFISWMLAACVIGFLVWNKPTARVFMGDVGSVTLGFVIMVLALIGEKQYNVPMILWLIVYGVFLFDATVTLLRRVVRKEPVYEAHSFHTYQRLNRSGFSHAEILYMLIGKNMVLTTLAVLGFYHREWMLALFGIAFVLLLAYYVWVERRNPM